MAHLIDLYHRLPYPLKIAAASLRGYQLRWWRYGKETDRLVEEALEREYWSSAQWQEWQENRLAFILERAARQVPYYRQQWQARRRNGDRATWAYLENWPILEKDNLHRQNEAFVAEDCHTKKMFHDHTSGTSGKSLNIWLSQETVRGWYALHEARTKIWHGLTRNDRWGILGGQLVTPYRQVKPPFWVWNAGLNQVYFSAYHLADRNLPAYIKAIKDYRLVYLLGYPSALFTLARYILSTGWEAAKLKAVIANAEPLLPHQRSAIGAAFQCPVVETYGVSETVVTASECTHGRLHLWPEAGYVELLDKIHETDGVSGELISTGLFNQDMPLIRYRVGDRIALAEATELCRCGRSLPMLNHVIGRTDDLLMTSDGRAIGRLDPVFKANLPVKEAQIIQEQLARVVVRYVPDEDFSQKDAASIISRIRDRMGEVEVQLEAVTEIPRGPNGKFRAVVCKLPDELRPVKKL